LATELESNARLEPSRRVWTCTPSPWSWHDALALGLLTFAVLAVFGRAAALKEALFYFDITEINYPYRDFLAREMRLGRFSRWMPSLFCGLPLYSESQAGYFHPFKLLYAMLPVWQALNIDTILSVWLAGAGAYAWLRRHVGAAGALVGASVIGMGGFTWAHWFHTSMINALASVPLILYGLESAWTTGRRRGMAIAGLALAAQVFAGHLQDALLSILLIGLYGTYRAATSTGNWSVRLRVLTPAIGTITVGVLVSAIQWIPSKELIDRSPRSGGLTYSEVVYGSWHPQLLPMSLVREAFGTRARDTDWMDGFYPYHEMNVFLGVLAMGLAVIGAGAYRDRWVGFWILLAALAFLLMLGRYGVLFDILYRVPVLGAGRIPVRYHQWLTLAVGALAAVGADRLARPGVVRLRGALLLIGVLVAASVPILIWTYIPAWTEAGRWTLRYHTDRFQWLGRETLLAGLRQVAVLLGGWTLARAAVVGRDSSGLPLRAGILAALVLFELTSAHWQDVPTISPAYWLKAPRTAAWIKERDNDPGRLFGFGVLAAGEPGYATSTVDFFAARDTLAWSLPPVWGLTSGWGHTPIYDKRLDLYSRTANEVGVRFDLEGVEYILTGPGLTVEKGRFGAPTVVGSTWIHANPGARPRAQLMGNPAYATSASDAAKQFEQLGRAVLDRIVVEDPSRPLPDTTPAPNGMARLLVDDPERVVVEVTTDQPAYLLLTDTYDPGWTATFDGRPVPVRPAQIAFRAVHVSEAGVHTVEFRYRPAGWNVGLSASLAGLLMALGLYVVRTRDTSDLDHVELERSHRWPWLVLVLTLLVVAAGIPAYSPERGVHLQSRWVGSFHRFTWGAGIEGMTRG
jgi:hypothetical protein